MNTHQVLIIIVDTRILCCVADSLQERRFASIGPSDYKYTKMSIFRSKMIGIAVAHHGRCVKDKEIAWEQYHRRSQPHAASCMASCRGFGFSPDLKNQTSEVSSYGELEGIYLISQLIGTRDAFDLREGFSKTISKTHGRFYNVCRMRVT